MSRKRTTGSGKRAKASPKASDSSQRTIPEMIAAIRKSKRESDSETEKDSSTDTGTLKSDDEVDLTGTSSEKEAVNSGSEEEQSDDSDEEIDDEEIDDEEIDEKPKQKSSGRKKRRKPDSDASASSEENDVSVATKKRKNNSGGVTASMKSGTRRPPSRRLLQKKAENQKKLEEEKKKADKKRAKKKKEEDVAQKARDRRAKAKKKKKRLTKRTRTDSSDEVLAHSSAKAKKSKSRRKREADSGEELADSSAKSKTLKKPKTKKKPKATKKRKRTAVSREHLADSTSRSRGVKKSRTAKKSGRKKSELLNLDLDEDSMAMVGLSSSTRARTLETTTSAASSGLRKKVQKKRRSAKSKSATAIGDTAKRHWSADDADYEVDACHFDCLSESFFMYYPCNRVGQSPIDLLDDSQKAVYLKEMEDEVFYNFPPAVYKKQEIQGPKQLTNYDIMCRCAELWGNESEYENMIKSRASWIGVVVARAMTYGAVFNPNSRMRSELATGFGHYLDAFYDKCKILKSASAKAPFPFPWTKEKDSGAKYLFLNEYMHELHDLVFAVSKEESATAALVGMFRLILNCIVHRKADQQYVDANAKNKGEKITRTRAQGFWRNLKRCLANDFFVAALFHSGAGGLFENSTKDQHSYYFVKKCKKSGLKLPLRLIFHSARIRTIFLYLFKMAAEPAMFYSAQLTMAAEFQLLIEKNTVDVGCVTDSQQHRNAMALLCAEVEPMGASNSFTNDQLDELFSPSRIAHFFEGVDEDGLADIFYKLVHLLFASEAPKKDAKWWASIMATANRGMTGSIYGNMMTFSTATVHMKALFDEIPGSVLYDEWSAWNVLTAIWSLKLDCDECPISELRNQSGIPEEWPFYSASDQSVVVMHHYIVAGVQNFVAVNSLDKMKNMASAIRNSLANRRPFIYGENEDGHMDLCNEMKTGRIFGDCPNLYVAWWRMFKGSSPTLAMRKFTASARIRPSQSHFKLHKTSADHLRRVSLRQRMTVSDSELGFVSSEDSAAEMAALSSAMSSAPLRTPQSLLDEMQWPPDSRDELEEVLGTKLAFGDFFERMTQDKDSFQQRALDLRRNLIDEVFNTIAKTKDNVKRIKRRRGVESAGVFVPITKPVSAQCLSAASRFLPTTLRSIALPCPGYMTAVCEMRKRERSQSLLDDSRRLPVDDYATMSMTALLRAYSEKKLSLEKLKCYLTIIKEKTTSRRWKKDAGEALSALIFQLDIDQIKAVKELLDDDYHILVDNELYQTICDGITGSGLTILAVSYWAQTDIDAPSSGVFHVLKLVAPLVSIVMEPTLTLRSTRTLNWQQSMAFLKSVKNSKTVGCSVHRLSQSKAFWKQYVSEARWNGGKCANITEDSMAAALRISVRRLAVVTPLVAKVTLFSLATSRMVSSTTTLAQTIVNWAIPQLKNSRCGELFRRSAATAFASTNIQHLFKPRGFDYRFLFQSFDKNRTSPIDGPANIWEKRAEKAMKNMGDTLAAHAKIVDHWSDPSRQHDWKLAYKPLKMAPCLPLDDHITRWNLDVGEFVRLLKDYWLQAYGKEYEPLKRLLKKRTPETILDGIDDMFPLGGCWLLAIYELEFLPLFTMVYEVVAICGQIGPTIWYHKQKDMRFVFWDEANNHMPLDNSVAGAGLGEGILGEKKLAIDQFGNEMFGYKKAKPMAHTVYIPPMKSPYDGSEPLATGVYIECCQLNFDHLLAGDAQTDFDVAQQCLGRKGCESQVALALADSDELMDNVKGKWWTENPTNLMFALIAILDKIDPRLGYYFMRIVSGLMALTFDQTLADGMDVDWPPIDGRSGAPLIERIFDHRTFAGNMFTVMQPFHRGKDGDGTVLLTKTRHIAYATLGMQIMEKDLQTLGDIYLNKALFGSGMDATRSVFDKLWASGVCTPTAAKALKTSIMQWVTPSVIPATISATDATCLPRRATFAEMDKISTKPRLFHGTLKQLNEIRESHAQYLLLSERFRRNGDLDVQKYSDAEDVAFAKSDGSGDGAPISHKLMAESQMTLAEIKVEIGSPEASGVTEIEDHPLSIGWLPAGAGTYFWIYQGCDHRCRSYWLWAYLGKDIWSFAYHSWMARYMGLIPAFNKPYAIALQSLKFDFANSGLVPNEGKRRANIVAINTLMKYKEKNKHWPAPKSMGTTKYELGFIGRLLRMAPVPFGIGDGEKDLACVLPFRGSELLSLVDVRGYAVNELTSKLSIAGYPPIDVLKNRFREKFMFASFCLESFYSDKSVQSLTVGFTTIDGKKGVAVPYSSLLHYAALDREVSKAKLSMTGSRSTLARSKAYMDEFLAARKMWKTMEKKTFSSAELDQFDAYNAKYNECKEQLDVAHKAAAVYKKNGGRNTRTACNLYDPTAICNALIDKQMGSAIAKKALEEIIASYGFDSYKSAPLRAHRTRRHYEPMSLGLGAELQWGELMSVSAATNEVLERVPHKDYISPLRVRKFKRHRVEESPPIVPTSQTGNVNCGIEPMTTKLDLIDHLDMADREVNDDVKMDEAKKKVESGGSQMDEDDSDMSDSRKKTDSSSESQEDDIAASALKKSTSSTSASSSSASSTKATSKAISTSRKKYVQRPHDESGKVQKSPGWRRQNNNWMQCQRRRAEAYAKQLAANDQSVADDDLQFRVEGWKWRAFGTGTGGVWISTAGQMEGELKIDAFVRIDGSAKKSSAVSSARSHGSALPDPITVVSPIGNTRAIADSQTEKSSGSKAAESKSKAAESESKAAESGSKAAEGGSKEKVDACDSTTTVDYFELPRNQMRRSHFSAIQSIVNEKMMDGKKFRHSADDSVKPSVTFGRDPKEVWKEDIFNVFVMLYRNGYTDVGYRGLPMDVTLQIQDSWLPPSPIFLESPPRSTVVPPLPAIIDWSRALSASPLRSPMASPSADFAVNGLGDSNSSAGRIWAPPNSEVDGSESSASAVGSSPPSPLDLGRLIQVEAEFSGTDSPDDSVLSADMSAPEDFVYDGVNEAEELSSSESLFTGGDTTMDEEDEVDADGDYEMEEIE